MDKKEAEAEALRKAKDTQAAAGKNSGMSGRDLFQYNPEWFIDEDEEGEEDWEFEKYLREKADADAAEEGFDYTTVEREAGADVDVDVPPDTPEASGSDDK